eukprot:TRINITY_DN3035_c2_g1_i2.p1 TRINITY_DN3035_c2_g1~~TRINITY_DN3035_c2_g1_i2.p1  ORF type:complete len:102 (-),score=14.69 TRINITY_DN3035_c2_g1_i2:673-978(-)
MVKCVREMETETRREGELAYDWVKKEEEGEKIKSRKLFLIRNLGRTESLKKKKKKKKNMNLTLTEMARFSLRQRGGTGCIKMNFFICFLPNSSTGSRNTPE